MEAAKVEPCPCIFCGPKAHSPHPDAVLKLRSHLSVAYVISAMAFCLIQPVMGRPCKAAYAESAILVKHANLSAAYENRLKGLLDKGYSGHNKHMLLQDAQFWSAFVGGPVAATLPRQEAAY